MSTAAASAASAEAAPTPAQLLFARALILTFELWPAMRLAVAEQWGGPDSAAKRDYLISHLADEYGGATGAVGSVSESKTAATNASASSTSASQTPPLPPPDSPDRDDIADLLDGYINDEFEVRLEDGTSDWVAGRIVELHHKIFYAESQEVGKEAVQALEEACAKLRGSKTQVQKAAEEDLSGSEDEEESEEEEEDGMDVDGQQQQPRQPRAKPQPEVDEDGFTTVVRRR